MSGLCKDCKWWEKLPREAWGSFDDGWKLCALGEAHNCNPEHPLTLALGHGWGDGTGWATIATAPDFGCVQFEAKP